MTLNDEDLKRIFRSYIGMRDPGTRQDCPSFNELSRFFEPGRRRRDRLRVIDHVTNCSACAEEFEFLRGLHNYEAQLTQNAREIRAKHGSYSISPDAYRKKAPVWRYAPITAGVLLLIVSLAIIMRWDHLQGTRTASSSVVLLKPGLGQSVPITIVFEWKSFKEADSYILEIFDDTLLPVWKSTEIVSAVFQPPEDLLGRLRADSTYYWMITALRNGNNLAESELRRFTLAHKAP